MVHVHIYQIVRKAEIDIPTTDIKGAIKVALEQAKRGQLIFSQSDCKFLAEGFDEEGQGHTSLEKSDETNSDVQARIDDHADGRTDDKDIKTVFVDSDVRVIGHAQIGPHLKHMTIQDLHHIIVRAIEKDYGRKFIKTACDHCGGVNKVCGVDLLFDENEKELDHVAVVLSAEPAKGL